MPAPKKTLEQLVLGDTFESRRAHHRALLAGEAVRWKALAGLQDRYAACDNEFEQRAIAKRFEQAIPAVLEQSRRRQASLDEVLAKLGPPGSAERAVNFFRQLLWIPRGPLEGRRFRLKPGFQEPWVRDLYERDRENRRIFNRALFGGPVGCGKTPLLTGLGLLETVDSLIRKAAVYGLASSREQAGSDANQTDRMHALARLWIEDGDLRRWVHSGSTITCRERRSFFKIVPADGRRALGVDPAFAIIEELSAFVYAQERSAYEAVLGRLNKRGPRMAALVAATNAGWDKGTILGELFDAALEHPGIEAYDERGKRIVDGPWCRLRLRDREGAFMFDWYGAHDDADVENPAILSAINPLLTRASVRDLLRVLHAADTNELQWRRDIANQWTVAKDAWLPLGTWARLAKARVEIPPGAEISVAVDAAFSWDTTAVVCAWRGPDGRVVLEPKVWTLRDDAPGHIPVTGPTLNNMKHVVPYIAGELASRYAIKHVVYDPNKFLAEAMHLEEEVGLTVAPLYPSSNRMREAESAFYRAAKDGSIVHDGDEILKAHVDATAGQRNAAGDWRIGKLFGKARPIDACIAAVMAHWAEITLEHEPLQEGDVEWLSEDELEDEAWDDDGVDEELGQ